MSTNDSSSSPKEQGNASPEPRLNNTPISEAFVPNTLVWTEDHLGPNFLSAELALGKDPDGESDIVATLVKYVGAKEDDSPRPAILYTHGMSDYFFQTHVAEYFHEHGYDFYALDLRKCGRSWRKGQSYHYITDLRYYFDELNLAFNVITQDHEKVIPMGHSTGGLLLALWLNYLHKDHKPEHEKIIGAIFNSPWLDLMAPRLATCILTAALNPLGKKYPHTLFPVGGLGIYGKSVHRDQHGFWDFNLDWKPIEGQRKYIGWMRSILISQRQIHQGRIDCGVPTLTLCSDKSYKGKEFSPEATSSDAVLWVEQIQRWAPKLSRNSTVRTIPDALHDVFLSGEVARNFAFQACTSWLAPMVESETQSGQ